MESNIAEALALRHEPVGIILTDEKPKDSVQLNEGKFGCVMAMFVAAINGRQVVFDRNTYGCPGGGTGLGFGNQYKNFPGGEKGFCYFLSTGVNGWGLGRKLARMAKPFVSSETYRTIINGEGYLRTPELVGKFLECLPITDIPYKYVVFRQLRQVEAEKEEPQTVVFLADLDQLSALVILANFSRDSNENVIIPMASGCQCIGIYPFREASREQPRAVVGIADISARIYLKRHLKDDVVSVAVPYAMFREMESNISGSFLERDSWNGLLKLKTA
ncbi:DUF169 domain-containing protein [Chloroflexota bacterium]